MSIAALILAAGLSRRMGDVDKLEVALGGRPLVDHSINAALSSLAAPVFVVTNTQVIAKRHPNITCIPAPDAALGQSHSVKAGFKALDNKPELTGTLVLLGDMPFITAHHIDALLHFANHRPNRICRYHHDGIPGHPVYWPRRLFGDLAALSGDDGARAVMRAHQSDVISLESEDSAVVFDVDTPERLDVARAQFTNGA